MNDNKTVCNCRKVTIYDIRKSMQNGNDTFEKVQADTGVSTVCKRCRDYAKNVFDAIADGE